MVAIKKWMGLVLLLLLIPFYALSEDGYDLWLRYTQINDAKLLAQYRSSITCINAYGENASLLAAKEELTNGLSGLLGKKINTGATIQNGSVMIGTAHGALLKAGLIPVTPLNTIGEEGFLIRSLIYKGKKITLITANTDIGVLYGSFHFLRLIQTNRPITNLTIVSSPKQELRLLNHWDNLDRHVERGYAGISLWNWHTLPDYKDPRYKDYARANASIGINGASLTNVNANAMVLTTPYLKKAAALAEIFRPYGIKVYLTARFSAPIEIGNLKTADPLNDTVRQWWTDKTKEIYELIPDFGGFLVKANSEGQPGPQNYGRDHADGANMLADAVAPFNGIVMWRAFVYSQQSDDRFKQAYDEFKPLDGKFRKNVLVQVKNGPIDFQPREPFSPHFGSMEQTPLMMEFQVTQEYLGQATHLVYEAPMFKEVLNSDTYKKGKGTEVIKTLSGMAGVSNIGNDRNWTGHLFGQANWYAYGRLAWDHELTSEEIAEEWIRMSLSNKKKTVDNILAMLLTSYEAMVNYMTPLGLHHIMGNGHHYGPAPWSDNLPRPDWNPVYYHKADAAGIGFDRTTNGTNALAQYAPEVQKKYEALATCDEKFLLWFHHVPWDHTMKSGRNLWEELCFRYQQGVDSVRWIRERWSQLEKEIDNERFEHVKMLLDIQVKEAVWWRDACLLYFQTFSNMPFPVGYEKPGHTLEYYKRLRFPYAPGN